MKDIPSYRLNFMNEVHPDELTYTYRPFAAYKDKKLKNPFSGCAVLYDDYGRLSFKRYYIEGLPEGPEIEYWKNGNLMSKRNFKKGKLHGLWEEYWENGKLSFRKNFKKDKLDGLWEKYNLNGNLILKFTYKDDVLDGPYERYSSKTGRIKEKGTYYGGTKVVDNVFE